MNTEKLIKPSSFSSDYAKYYDLMYSGYKDYSKEIQFINNIFKKLANINVKTVFDSACGTGSHCIELSRIGYKVTGADISEGMIKIARKKASAEKQKIDFQSISMQRLRIDSKFDAVICLFASFDYIIKEREIMKSLKNINALLSIGGIFIMDFWNENVFKNYEGKCTVKDIDKNGLRLLRISETKKSRHKNTFDVHIKCIAIKRNKIISEIREVHKCRYFSMPEIKRCFETSGFRVLKFCPFLELDSAPENSGFVTVIAEKI